jgi:ankyrin repeat protein
MIRLLLFISLFIFQSTNYAFAQIDASKQIKEQVIPEVDDYYKRISFDDVDGVKQSLKIKGLTPNTMSKYGDAPLPFAVRENAMNVFKYLLQVPDINIDKENKNTENALMMLAFKGNLEMVKYLVEKFGAEIDKDGWNPMHYAVTNGHLDIVKYFISKEADVDSGTPNNTTALMLASRAGFIEIVKYLLDHKADLALHNDQNLTAIDFAQMGNQTEIVNGLKSRWKKMYGFDYVPKPRILPSN